MQSEQGVLVLEDGQEFSGYLFGTIQSLPEIEANLEKAHRPRRSQSDFRDSGFGEVVFNTSMTGYQEILTDPSYLGQIICMTTAHVGNTGIHEADSESSAPHCAGFVVRELCDLPSNWRSSEDLPSYLKRQGITGISGVDTRTLTRHLRAKGVVRGVILKKKDRESAGRLLKLLPPFEGRDLIREASTPSPFKYDSPKKALYRVAVLDYGIKANLLRSLRERGCQLEVFPATTTGKEILASKPDGVFLSNGPGDPSAAPYAVETVKELLGKVPMFGVCMGHQILSLALGAKTYKMKFGHRGGNQPVLNHLSGQVEISSHNHGYTIDRQSLPKNVKVTHVNLNDQTVEGIEVSEAKAFSVQFHPESCPGPHDSYIHFERFISLMRK